MAAKFDWNSRQAKLFGTSSTDAFIAQKAEIPRLLVSVRSRSEADRAISGGAEILDVKEPSHGSLGMATVDDIVSIAQAPNISAGKIPLSVALGEVCDWPIGASIPVLPPGISFAKVGLSQCRQRADWIGEWLRVRSEFQNRSLSKLRWVAVAYADMAPAASPDIFDVLAMAIETNCAGLLVDTWTKDGRTLLDEITPATLTKVADQCHASGLFLTLAGRIHREALDCLSEIPSDVIAIRSAACNSSDRTAELEPNRVAQFRKDLAISHMHTVRA